MRTIRIFPPIITLSLAAYLLIVFEAVAQNRVSYRPIAISGHLINEQSDLRFDMRTGEPDVLIPLRSFDLNNEGNVAFQAELSDSTSGLFLNVGGQNELLAQTGAPPRFAPPGQVFKSFHAINISDQNTVVYGGTFGIPKTSSQSAGGVWIVDNSETKLIARTGLPTADAASERVLPFDLITAGFLNEREQVLLGVYHQGQTTQILADDRDGQGFRNVAMVGSNEIAAMSYFGYNDLGEAFFFATLPGNSPLGGGSDFDPNRSVWSEAGGSLHTIATTTDGSFGAVNSPHMNNNGDFVFLAHLTNGKDLQLVRSDAIGNLQPIITTGEKLPGREETVEFLMFDNHVVDAHGNIAFAAGSNNRSAALLLDSPERGLETLAFSGDSVAPGSEETWSTFGNISSNAHGELAFAATTQINGRADSEGLWIWRENAFTRVVSTGQALRIDPNDEREIVQISVVGSSNNEDGRQSHFNDASQVLFGAQFADDRVGLFVATPQAGKCDVNIDGRCNMLDIDDIANAIRIHSTDDIFDIDASGTIDSNDLTTLVETEFNTWIGDANLDGVFDSSDLVSVFVKAEYEDQFASNSTWSDGDWNGDAEFDSADLVAAFVRAGYEMGSRPNVNRVPEPGISSVGLILLFGFALRRSKSNRAAVTFEPLNDY